MARRIRPLASMIPGAYAALRWDRERIWRNWRRDLLSLDEDTSDFLNSEPVECSVGHLNRALRESTTSGTRVDLRLAFPPGTRLSVAAGDGVRVIADQPPSASKGRK